MNLYIFYNSFLKLHKLHKDDFQNINAQKTWINAISTYCKHLTKFHIIGWELTVEIYNVIFSL